MSCNGCRVLRKGCSDSCILRSSLLGIDSPEAQGHATVFVAKFFGRAGMISFINAVPESQRPALFQSLLYEACGRTVNPVFGAVGLLWTGNWAVCQAAVDTVLKGGSLKPTTSILGNPSIIKPNTTMIPTKFAMTLHPDLERPSSSSSHPSTLAPASNPLVISSDPNPNPNPNVNPNMNPNPLKRSRPSPPPLEEKHPAAPESKPEIDSANHHSSPIAGETFPSLPSCEHVVKDAGPTPNLIAPVPRRVRPIILAGHNNIVSGSSSDHTTLMGSRRPSPEIHDTDASMRHVDQDSNVQCVVELNLTLNSHANLGSICKHSNGSSPRVSSPCSFSEGSVTTSLDTSELSVSCFRAALSPQGSLCEAPQLLKLL